MVIIFVLSLALFSGATSAFQWESPLSDVVIVPNITTNATILEQNPWVVQVDMYHPWGAWSQICAASILNSRYVLSSASCFSGSTYYRRIRAGANYRNTDGTIVYITAAANYGGQITNGTFHDISVVLLQAPLVFSHLIRQGPIVAPGTFIPAGLALNQIGWGLQNNSHIGLSSAAVTIFTRSSNQTQPSNTTAPILTAYPSAGAKFNGDIGSPWVIGNVTVGILSGVNSAVNGSWSDTLIAVSVTAYTDWIVRVAV